MEELEIYEMINGCETINRLMEVIKAISEDCGGYIKGRKRLFDGHHMALMAEMFYNDDSDTFPASTLTRSWGIRQQAIYLKYYKHK